MKKLLIILLLGIISIGAYSQYNYPSNAICYGQPIRLVCSLEGCNYPGTTFTWQNRSGSWRVTGYDGKPGVNMDSIRNPIIEVGETGYKTDFFYLQAQYAPPPQGASGGRVWVTVYSKIVIIKNTTSPTCITPSGGAINNNVTGGTSPYSYIWSNAATTKDISGLTQGSYTVTVTDAHACNSTSSTSLVLPPGSVPSLVKHDTFCQRNNGAIFVLIDPSCFTTPISYLWSTGETVPNLVGLPSGTYTVTITDSDSHSSILSSTVQ